MSSLRRESSASYVPSDRAPHRWVTFPIRYERYRLECGRTLQIRASEYA